MEIVNFKHFKNVYFYKEPNFNENWWTTLKTDEQIKYL